MSYALEIEIPASAPPYTIAFPSSESESAGYADTEESTTPTGLPALARQRASSIPSTPISTHVDHLRVRPVPPLQFILKADKKLVGCSSSRPSLPAVFRV
jgi:hypothetical protein